MDRRARLLRLEQDIDTEAREYKRRRLAEEMQKLADEDASALFPPGQGYLPAGANPPHDGSHDGRTGSA